MLRLTPGPSWLFITPRGVWIIMGVVTLIVIIAFVLMARSVARNTRGTDPGDARQSRRETRRMARQAKGPSRRQVRKSKRSIRANRGRNPRDYRTR